MSKKVMELSIGTWIAIASLALTLVGAGGAVMSKIYASKTEVAEVKSELKDTIETSKEKAQTQLQNWRIKTVEVRVENLDTRQQGMAENVVKLMEKFRVEPVKSPSLKPLPSPPDSLDGIE